MPPASGYCDATSAKTPTTMNWPKITIGIDQMKAGPPVNRPYVNSE